ncbi:MAG: LEPR-XLL domain-containing protein [Phycisphaeraceae bacterium]|nr:LEPR-XLL domain-containing protein [Phycisphaeraceae bacterium]
MSLASRPSHSGESFRSCPLSWSGPWLGLEALEPRLLLSGVTLLTHGYQPLSSDRPTWLDAMAAAVVAQAGVDTAVYALRIELNSSNDPFVSSFQLLAGLSPTSSASSNSETVIMLDWADASGVFLSYVSTAVIADLVAPYLLDAVPSAGLSSPLAESPIQLIGHSRGGSLVSELALNLANQGVWVDQMTTLDPHPVSSDPAVKVWDNVWFADNYYRTDDFFTPGQSVNGAHNINLTSVSPDVDHSEVHTFYHGTIDLAASSADGLTIENAWYGYAHTGPRSSVGFAWSRLGAAAQPADGLWPTGSRQAAAVTAAGPDVWDNIRFLSDAPDESVYQGQIVQPQAAFEDQNQDSTLTVGLDLDANPYNGVLASYDQSISNPAQAEGTWTPTLDTTLLDGGQYHLYAKISNGVHIRYYYTSGLLTVIELIPGDFDGDGAVTLSDINPFKQALTDTAVWQSQYPEVDLSKVDPNGDGVVTLSDVNPFKTLLAGGSSVDGQALRLAPQVVPSPLNEPLASFPEINDSSPTTPLRSWLDATGAEPCASPWWSTPGDKKSLFAQRRSIFSSVPSDAQAPAPAEVSLWAELPLLTTA